MNIYVIYIVLICTQNKFYVSKKERPNPITESNENGEQATSVTETSRLSEHLSSDLFAYKRLYRIAFSATNASIGWFRWKLGEIIR